MGASFSAARTTRCSNRADSKEIYDLQLKDQEQFRREMLFLDESEIAAEERGNGSGRKSERLMDGV
jgi:hypothetical protein